MQLNKLILFRFSNFILCALLMVSLHAQDNTIYQKVKIKLRSNQIIELAKLGVEVEHGYNPSTQTLINFYSEEIVNKIKDHGFDVVILQQDAVKHFIEENKTKSPHPTGSSIIRSDLCNHKITEYPQPVNFRYGSMGYYLTYDEILEELDSMKSKFPDLITNVQNVSDVFVTAKGRKIKYVKISDFASNDESADEPEILYTALTHAREPMSMTQLIYFMWYILENYETDPEIKYLLDNAELYFIPCVNPDGYVYNQTSASNGGGQWRKNRSGELPIGVDLNRNFEVGFAYNNIGSSPDKSSETYRGPIQFSEAETKAIKSFFNIHNFSVASNAHSFGNVLIHPWGYTNRNPIDSATYFQMRSFLTERNDYSSGLNIEVLDYEVNGTSDDWMYGKGNGAIKTYAFTSECGPAYDEVSQSFWPTVDKIIPICDQLIESNIRTIWFALNYTDVKTSTSFITNYSNVKCRFTLQNFGLSIKPVEVSVSSIKGDISPVNFTQTLILNNLQKQDIEVPISFKNTKGFQSYSLVVKVDYGGYIQSDTFNFNGSNFKNYYTNNGNNLADFDNITGEPWYISSDAYSSPTAFSVTDKDNYKKAENRVMHKSEPIKLDMDSLIILSMKAKWDIQQNRDYFKVSVSTDGIFYQQLCGQFTRPGSIEQNELSPITDGLQSNWVSEYYDLTEFAGESIYLNFEFRSDARVFGKGIQIDDIQVIGIPGQSVNKPEIINDQIAIYPNPFVDRITLKDPNLIGSNFEILDSRGSQLMGEVLSTQQIDLQSLNLPEGLYFIKIIPKNGPQRISKIIKSK